MQSHPQRMPIEAYDAHEAAQARRWMIANWLENQDLQQQVATLKGDVQRCMGGSPGDNRAGAPSGPLGGAFSRAREARAPTADCRLPTATFSLAREASETRRRAIELWLANLALAKEVAALNGNLPRKPGGAPAASPGALKADETGYLVREPWPEQGVPQQRAALGDIYFPAQPRVPAGSPEGAQPRVPAGSPEGGQWTAEGGSGSTGSIEAALAHPGEASVTLVSRNGRTRRRLRRLFRSRRLLGQGPDPSGTSPAGSPLENRRLQLARERADTEVARARSLDPSYAVPAPPDPEPEALTRFYNELTEHARTAANRAEAELILPRRGIDAARLEDLVRRSNSITPEQVQRLWASFERLRSALVRAMSREPDYPLPGNIGYRLLHGDVEGEIGQIETAADNAGNGADHLEALAYDPDRKLIDYGEMRAARALERRFNMALRRPNPEERGGVDYIDANGTKWDVIGASADEATNYDGFIESLKNKLLKLRADKIAVDTRLMGEELSSKVMQYIRGLYPKVQNKIVYITHKGVYGSN